MEEKALDWETGIDASNKPDEAERIKQGGQSERSGKRIGDLTASVMISNRV